MADVRPDRLADCEAPERRRLLDLGWEPVPWPGGTAWRSPEGPVYTSTEAAVREMRRREGKGAERG